MKDEELFEEFSDVNLENTPLTYEQVTGFKTSQEYMSYYKGREDEQTVIMDWIKKWNGEDNSMMGNLLLSKFKELKDKL